MKSISDDSLPNAVRILVVEDDRPLLEMMSELASSLGYEISVATDGIEAMDLLADHNYSIIITDIDMPRMDGMELLKQSSLLYPDVGVIMVTGFFDKYSFSDVVSAGAIDFISKPFRSAELAAKIKRAIRERDLVGNLKLEIRDRQRAEDDLKRALGELEKRVDERTAEFMAANEKMATEIAERQLTERALLESESALARQKMSLEEVNTALKVLLEKRERDKSEIGERVLANVKGLIEPYVDRLKASGLSERQRAYVQIIETNMNDIISPFARSAFLMKLRLTPAEMKVASLIKDGQTTKEIADIMGLSPETINSHRKKIRKKSGITNKKINLRAVLASLSR